MNEQLNRQQVAVIRSMSGLAFDAVFEETHEADLEVTDNPVETGVVVSDHAFMKPLKVTISAGVSDTPLAGWGGGFQINAGALVGGGTGEGKDFWSRNVTRDPFASDTSRSKRAYELLTELQKRAEPFDLQTGLKLYKNMVITSIRTSQDKDTSGALLFTAELREVIVVKTKIMKYELLAPRPGPTARQAKPMKHKGEQQGKEVTSETEKKKLKGSLADALGIGKLLGLRG